MRVSCTQLSATEISGCIDALRRRVFSAAARSEVDQLAEQLDAQAWDVQHAADRGCGDATEYLAAFRKARASAAVGFTLSGTLAGARESLFEAFHAVDDRAAFLSAVIG
ncbi:hypothetical protein ACQPXB_43700 [Amycolatopsis sp. CA-161197]|uniref:hypothetical protein n=1 Tax=Amycolatopsis sp. CA-161197 TaxID=3239922 RepID=UPI003D905911